MSGLDSDQRRLMLTALNEAEAAAKQCAEDADKAFLASHAVLAELSEAKRVLERDQEAVR